MTFNKATTTNYTRMQQYRMGQVKMCTQGRNRIIIPWQITKHASKEGADEQDKQHAMSDAEVHPPRCHARLDPVQSENKQKRTCRALVYWKSRRNHTIAAASVLTAACTVQVQALARPKLRRFSCTAKKHTQMSCANSMCCLCAHEYLLIQRRNLHAL